MKPPITTKQLVMYAGAVLALASLALIAVAYRNPPGTATKEIARNIQQAASGTQDVTSNISGVQQAATDAGAAATQVLGAAEHLSQQSKDLAGQVNRFLADVRAA